MDDNKKCGGDLRPAREYLRMRADDFDRYLELSGNVHARQRCRHLTTVGMRIFGRLARVPEEGHFQTFDSSGKLRAIDSAI